MADTLTTKKVTELTENTAMSDEDLFMVGSAGTASLRKLKWSNIWNTIKTAILGKLVANNLTTTAAGYLLDARQGKALDDKISKLNTDLKNNIIAVSRTSAAWLAESYKSYNVCEYTIQSDGIYLAFATVIISETKADRAYYMALNQNSEGNGSRTTMIANNAYNVIAPLSYVFTCKAGDRIYTSAQANYVAENYAGLATGYLKLIKLHS